MPLITYSQLVEIHEFGSTDVQHYIYSDGRTWKFEAKNTMIVDSIEVLSVLGISGRYLTFNIEIGIQDSLIDKWDHYIPYPYVGSFAPHIHNKKISFSLSKGDTIIYKISCNSNWVSQGVLTGISYIKLFSEKVTQFKSICEGEEYQGWTETGEYQKTFTSSTGCDSTVTTFLTVAPTYRLEENISICEGEEYQGWTETGEYQKTFTSSTGCDSTVTTFLTVAPTYRLEEYISICEGETYKGWDTERQYTENLISVSGCDSIVITNLSFYPSYQPAINIDINTLSTPLTNVSYQWCDENGDINGATDKEYTIAKSGEYYLVITDENGCTDTSAIVNAIYTSANKLAIDDFVYSIIPNPNTGKFTFRIDSDFNEEISLKLVNTIGQIIEIREVNSAVINHVEQFDVSHLSKGIYHLVISSEKYHKSEKIVVQ